MQNPYELLKNTKKVILAYSGGLDTSVLVTWLKEQGVAEVICVAGNVGQISDPEALEEKALKTGASKFYCPDLAEEFLDDYVFPTLQAGAKYENVYLLGTASARPVIAKSLVEIARKENTDVIVHGCTGKGNDQVRFELTINALAPEMKVVAPWRFWDIKGRSQEIDYAEAHNIPLEFSRDEDYSMDENLWHLSHEGLDLEDPANAADLDKILHWITPPEKAPDQAEIVEIEFVQGKPVGLNGQKMSSVELVAKLNDLGSKYGIGIDDIVESRLVGMKSRGVYENPAGSILYFAHQKLESITVEADTLHFKLSIAHKYAELVYYGKWENTLRRSLAAFVAETQKFVTGTVKVKLYKGSMQPAGLSSPYSLFDESYATFEQDDVFDHADADGFIRLFGLSSKIQAMLQKEKNDS
ncbi:MAG: argininosuccinate synthase [Clostridiaceae bacterium]|jgi:argininosuccinate synthase|nr:argininosuccinate synthase [Bacillota bacterium]NLN51862.1 argininosuccinate synthase [Clostridiaceae bacterium]